MKQQYFWELKIRILIQILQGILFLNYGGDKNIWKKYSTISQEIAVAFEADIVKLQICMGIHSTQW